MKSATGAACCGGHETSAIDPVCGMHVTIAPGTPQANHDGVTYYFCCPKCLARFVAEPERFLSGAPVQISAPPGTKWICSMCPEVEADGPGACPVCGMALEPALPVAGAHGENAELKDMSLRFWIALALTLPVFVLEMGGHLFGWSLGLSHKGSAWIQAALTTPVVLWAGWPFLVRGWVSLMSRRFNMFTLIALGVLSAWIVSCVTLIVNPHAMVYFEAAAVIVTLTLLGQVLELRARDAAGGAIRALMNLSPKIARRVRPDGDEEDVPVEMIAVGDHLRVRPGEAVPVDGVIFAGRSTLDESLVTGEAMPVVRASGEAVTGGTINGSGTFVMKAVRVGHKTMLARIVALVAEAQRSRAPVQRLADRVAAWFVPVVVAIAAMTFCGWLLFAPERGAGSALMAAVAVLIIACPCALGLATPMAVTAGVARGARAGILVRDAAALEAFARADTLMLDKTGTLTEGCPSLAEIVMLSEDDEADALRLAASVEALSEHPLGVAIVAGAKARGLNLLSVEHFISEAGRGVEGVVEGRTIRVSHTQHPQADALRQTGATVMMLSVDGATTALIAVADAIKPSACKVVEKLKADGLHLVMLTGDHETTARHVAEALRLNDVRAGMTPSGKLDTMRAMQARGAVVAMAGDGVNDAPALAAADCGVAMGTGADAALASAGITLLNGDISGLVRARRLALGTLKTIRQNLWLAFGYNAAAVPLAALGIARPEVAALAMSLSSVSVILNAMRLQRITL